MIKNITPLFIYYFVAYIFNLPRLKILINCKTINEKNKNNFVYTQPCILFFIITKTVQTLTRNKKKDVMYTHTFFMINESNKLSSLNL